MNNWKTRQNRLDYFRTHTTTVDVCVVGGGITGAAIARESAARGLKTILIEKDDFAYGTSSRSSKLVHGGVRYLENYEFKLVAESTSERARLWSVAPDLVKPLAFLFPAFDDSRLKLWKLNLGLWLYDFLSLFRSPTLHRKLSSLETQKQEPALRSSGLKGSIFYWDAETDDSLLTLSNILDAEKLGAVCLSRCKLESVQWNKKTTTEPNQFHALTLRDTLNPTADPINLQCRTLVSATGPWTDEFFSQVLHQNSKRMRTTRGSHIVVSKEKIPLKHAVVMTHPKDGRVLFGIPWAEETIIGTTDVFDNKSPDLAVISADEIQYLVEASNYFFPKNLIQKSDIIAVWSGLRPLLAPPDKASESEISREHSIEWFDPGLLVIAGGKLTTHRVMAIQTIEKIESETNNWEHRLFKKHQGINTRNRKFPKLPQVGIRDFSDQLITEICQTQAVLTLEDFFVRRTEIFYVYPKNGLELLEKIKSPMCSAMNWNPTQWQSQVENYKKYLYQNMYKSLGRTIEP